MNKLIDLESYPVQPVLGRLLADKSSRQNIIFATDAYASPDRPWNEQDPITLEALTGEERVLIQPRVEKAAEEQLARTRKKAEVFTPSWIVNKMNNYCDEDWFQRPGVFNAESGTAWTVNPEPVAFPKKKTWKKYVDSRRIEITCGEAPYLVSRYDAATGELIPIQNRIGILDRKLRVVNENAADDAEWLAWTLRAFQATYGYEFQGDNLLIARVNLLMTYVEYYTARFQAPPTARLLRKLANVIAWNLWQMDGITGTLPYKTLRVQEDKNQMSLFALFGEEEEPDESTAPACRVMDWRAGRSVSYDDIRGGRKG